MNHKVFNLWSPMLLCVVSVRTKLSYTQLVLVLFGISPKYFNMRSYDPPSDSLCMKGSRFIHITKTD